MSDKQKKFQPSAGYIVAVHQNALGIRAVAQALDMFPEVLADALEQAGFQLIADPFDLSADASKLIKLQAKQETEKLHVVREETNDAGSDSGSN